MVGILIWGGWLLVTAIISIVIIGILALFLKGSRKRLIALIVACVVLPLVIFILPFVIISKEAYKNYTNYLARCEMYTGFTFYQEPPRSGVMFGAGPEDFRFSGATRESDWRKLKALDLDYILAYAFTPERSLIGEAGWNKLSVEDAGHPNCTGYYTYDRKSTGLERVMGETCIAAEKASDVEVEMAVRFKKIGGRLFDSVTDKTFVEVKTVFAQDGGKNAIVKALFTVSFNRTKCQAAEIMREADKDYYLSYRIAYEESFRKNLQEKFDRLSK